MQVSRSRNGSGECDMSGSERRVLVSRPRNSSGERDMSGSDHRMLHGACVDAEALCFRRQFLPAGRM